MNKVNKKKNNNCDWTLQIPVCELDNTPFDIYKIF